MGLWEGACKYGVANWRATGVKASVYIGAIKRHSAALAEGIDIDPDSGLPQLCHILACAAILVDAKEAGVLIDDRHIPGGDVVDLMSRFSPHVVRIREKYAHLSPTHYTRDLQEND